MSTALWRGRTRPRRAPSMRPRPASVGPPRSRGPVRPRSRPGPGARRRPGAPRPAAARGSAARFWRCRGAPSACLAQKHGWELSQKSRGGVDEGEIPLGPSAENGDSAGATPVSDSESCPARRAPQEAAEAHEAHQQQRQPDAHPAVPAPHLHLRHAASSLGRARTTSQEG